MRKFIVVLAVVTVVFIVWNRNRLYMRDPLASVTRAGVKEHGVQVFINYSNDILLENDHAPMYVYLIRHGQRAGVPIMLRCIHYVVCLTDADQATFTNVDGIHVDSMTGKMVSFHEGTGGLTAITLH